MLQYPLSLGYDDALEATGPCDTFDPTARTDASNFIVEGEAILVLTTHPNVTWNINAALVSDPTNFVPITEDVWQKGVGYFCFSPIVPSIPASWIGQPAVLQLRQHAPDGTLYQVSPQLSASGEQTEDGLYIQLTTSGVLPSHLSTVQWTTE